MNHQAANLLIDVFALSKKLCAYPIEGKLAYATNENFVGRIIDGYAADADDVCLLTIQPASALCEVQNHLNKKQLGLYIYDAYRPLRAVKDFAQWYHQPVIDHNELERKKIHYPNLEKTALVQLGYAPDTVSRHNFGHAVDLTLIDIANKKFLDLGACFDFFDELSHITATDKQIGKEAYKNRLILAEAMQEFVFIPYENEYWHFDYKIQETEQAMDMPIVKQLKNLNVTQVLDVLS